MTRRGYLFATASAALLAISGFGAVALLAPHPRLLWNATASAPTGLYRLTPDAHPPVGTLVAVMPPAALAEFMASRRYLPSGVPLLKHVAGKVGDRICRHGRRVSVDGRAVAIAQPHDRHGRPLPLWGGCRRLGRHDLFLLNGAPDSLDSRYFGPIPDAGLLGRATPMLTRDAPGAPLRWRGFGPAASLHPAPRR